MQIVSRKNKLEKDLNNKILNIKIVNPDMKNFTILVQGVCPGWSVNLESDLEPSQSEIRTDKNLLTGCLTIYNWIRNIGKIHLDSFSKNM